MSDAVGISIVVPDEGRALDRVLESIAQQDYRAVETIVEKGGSFGAALERGFAKARGDVFGYLRADEILLPGALHGVSAQMAGERGPDVVMGRSAYRVEEAPGIAVPHPSEYLGVFDHLAVWKRGFDAVPRASLFFRRAVRQRIGAFLDADAFAVDYDFVCRVEKRYALHGVGELWSAALAPGHDAQGEHERLEALVAISRRHWGSWMSLLRWRCEAVYALHRLNPHDHARHHARRCERALAGGRRLEAAVELLKTWLYSPSMARGRFARR